MPAAAESSIKPDINDMLHHICIDDPGPHNQDIGVIMLTGSLRGKSIMAQGGPDTCKFVGGDAHADAGTADKYSPFSLARLHSLGYSIICEGVETDAQRQLLMECGCYKGQGYLFSRPLPISEYEARFYGTNE